MDPTTIQIIERLGSFGLLAVGVWWIVVRQVPAEREKARETYKEIAEMFARSMKEEREVCRQTAQAVTEVARTLYELRREIRDAVKWNGSERRGKEDNR